MRLCKAGNGRDICKRSLNKLATSLRIHITRIPKHYARNSILVIENKAGAGEASTINQLNITNTPILHFDNPSRFSDYVATFLSTLIST